MAAKLIIGPSDALQSGESLPLVETKTKKVYVLVDQIVHNEAMAALQRQQGDDMAVIQLGIDDMEAGRVMTLEESQARTEAALANLKQ